MEAKDGLDQSKKSLVDRMGNALLREIEEESKIKNVSKLRYTGLVLQSQEPDYPKNH